jgi:hypothetical protein
MKKKARRNFTMKKKNVYVESDELVDMYLDHIQEQGDLTPTRKSVQSAIGAVTSVASGGAGWLGYRILKGAFSECARNCGMFGINTMKRQYCLISCKAKAAEKQLAYAKANLSKCNGDQRCLEKMKVGIAKIQSDVAKLNDKRNSFRNLMLRKGKDISKGEEVEPGGKFKFF